MANLLYPLGKKAFLEGGINLSADTIKAVLIDSADYTYNAAHDFYNDVSAGAVGTPQTLASKTVGTVAAGVFDAANVTFAALTGDSAEALVIYKDTGNPATSPLIAYFDSATGLPATPNGGDIVINWNASGIFGI